ncbi:MAG: helix-turn-helix domain-containing protein [Alphaproteobacteria bacterium]|nr:helix-turn-helix domain-containing protein [Alphaproteobacteria bacterium]
MSAGFYQRLGVQPGATPARIREAFHLGLARLVKKQRSAKAGGGDMAGIEVERAELQEAHDVLTDPARRRRYDLMLALEGEPLGDDPASIGAALEPALIDPAAAAAVELLADLTALPLNQAELPAAPARPAPAPEPAVSMMSAAQRQQRAMHAVAAAPEPLALDPAPDASAAPPPFVMAEPSIAPAAAPVAVTPEDEDVSLAEMEFLAGNFGHDGRYLAAIRQGRGLSLEDLAETTRISLRYLTALEENDFEGLPAAVFVRGYLKEVAQVLGVDDEPLLQGYMARFNQARGG